MKTIGIQIDGNVAVLVVINETGGEIEITSESRKIKLDDHTDNIQVRQFRDEIKSTFDSVQPDRIGIKKRIASARAKMKSSPVSFKLEGIIQLYDSRDIEFIAPQTVTAYYKKQEFEVPLMHNYQEDAAKVGYYLIKES